MEESADEHEERKEKNSIWSHSLYGVAARIRQRVVRSVVSDRVRAPGHMLKSAFRYKRLRLLQMESTISYEVGYLRVTVVRKYFISVLYIENLCRTKPLPDPIPKLQFRCCSIVFFRWFVMAKRRCYTQCGRQCPHTHTGADSIPNKVMVIIMRRRKQWVNEVSLAKVIQHTLARYKLRRISLRSFDVMESWCELSEHIYSTRNTENSRYRHIDAKEMASNSVNHVEKLLFISRTLVCALILMLIHTIDNCTKITRQVI